MSDGGAIRLRSSHSAVSFYMSKFEANNVASRGGVFAMEVDNGKGLLSVNQIFIQNCTASGNSASEGGVLYMSSSNDVKIYDSTIMSNNGDKGGSIYTSRSNNLLIQSAKFSSNNAKLSGGAIFAQDSNNLEINGANFESNSAKGGGGALYCEQFTVLSFTGTDVANTSFASNVAAIGGSILYRKSNVWNVDSNTIVKFNDNKAHLGSAIVMTGVTFPYSTSQIEKLALDGNVASLGGTIYWIKDSIMNTFPNISSSVVWGVNVAEYGEMIGTQTTSLRGPTVYNVTMFGESLKPPPEYFAYDAYDQKIPFDGDGTTASVIVSNYTGCNGLYGYLTGMTDFSFIGGSLQLDGMAATCTPTGHMEIVLEFRSALSQLLMDSSTSLPQVEAKTTLRFRDCINGETLVQPYCQVCGDYTYSLIYDPNAQCDICAGIPGIRNCSAKTLNLNNGYWRRTEVSDAIFECPIQDACLGGAQTGDVACETGYEGPMCAVCSEGYFMSEGVCLPCNETANIFTPQLIVLVCILSLAILVAACGYFYTNITAKSELQVNEELNNLSANDVQKAQDAIKERELMKNLKEDANKQPPSQLEIWYLWLKVRSSAIMVKVKIIVATVQVVSETPSIFSIKFPSSFEKFSDSFGFLNISLSGIFPLACGSGWTFIDNMILTTLAPIGACVLIFLAFEIDLYMRLKKVRQEQNEDDRIGHNEQLVIEAEQYEEAKDKYFNYFFYLTYLVLPNVTLTIFETFVCVNVDPDNNDNYEYDYFLKADLSLNCEDNYYKSGVIYAVFMLFVYPIGIPVMYYYFLNHAKEEIKGRDNVIEEEVDIDNNKVKNDGAVHNLMHSKDTKGGDQMVEVIESQQELSPATLRLAFLYSAYEPQFWYFELIETNRRLMMTAVLSILSPGTSEQAVAAVVLSVFYIKLYNHTAPYCEDSDDVLAETGQFQIFFTFFFGLVLSNQLVSAGLNNVLGMFLVLMNLGVVVLTCRYEIKAALEEQEALKEEEQSIVEKEKLLSQSDKTSNSVSNTTASKRRSSIIVQSALESNDHHHRRRTSGMVMVKAAQEYERAIHRRRSSTANIRFKVQSDIYSRRECKDSDDEDTDDEAPSVHTTEAKDSSSMEMEMVSIVDTSGLPLSLSAPPSSDIVFQTKKSNNE